MKKKLGPLWPYIAMMTTIFYLLPLLARDTGSGMLLMLCVMPLAALLAGVAHGARRGFSLWLPVAALLLFLPTIPLFYNWTAWPYAIVYALFVLAGMGVGRLFYGRR